MPLLVVADEGSASLFYTRFASQQKVASALHLSQISSQVARFKDRNVSPEDRREDRMSEWITADVGLILTFTIQLRKLLHGIGLKKEANGGLWRRPITEQMRL